MNIDAMENQIFQSIQFDSGSRFLETVNQISENPVLILDCSAHPLLHPTTKLPADYEVWLEAAKAVPLSARAAGAPFCDAHGRHWLTAPIQIRNTIIGYAVACDKNRPFRSGDDRLLTHIGNAAALQCSILGQMAQESDLSPHAHRMFFDDLLDEQIAKSNELSDRLREIGWRTEGQFYVVVVWLRDVERLPQTPTLHGTLARQIARVVPVYTYTFHFNQLILLLQFPDQPTPGMTDVHVAAMEQLMERLDLRAGVSRLVSDLLSIHEGFSQANMAVEMGRKLNFPQHFIPYDTISMYHMIQISRARINDPGIFIHRAVNILLEHDRKHRQCLLWTLQVYLEESKSIRRTAQRLCIHKNTLFYRLRRIQELTGVNLDRSEENFHLHMSFLILRYDGVDVPK